MTHYPERVLTGGRDRFGLSLVVRQREGDDLVDRSHGGLLDGFGFGLEIGRIAAFEAFILLDRLNRLRLAAGDGDERAFSAGNP